MIVRLLRKPITLILMSAAPVQVGATSAMAQPPAATTAAHDVQALVLADQAGAATAAGETWKALALMRKAATLAPRNARLRSGLGQAYLAVRLYGSAAASFADALAIDAQDGGARRGWTTAQNALGRTGAELAGFGPAADVQYRTASAD